DATGNVQGNGSKFQLFTGSAPAANDCAKFDASGNVVTNGAACASGGVTGSGTSGLIPKWTGSTALGNSLLSDNGTIVTSQAQLCIGYGANTCPTTDAGVAIKAFTNYSDDTRPNEIVEGQTAGATALTEYRTNATARLRVGYGSSGSTVSSVSGGLIFIPASN